MSTAVKVLMLAVILLLALLSDTFLPMSAGESLTTLLAVVLIFWEELAAALTSWRTWARWERIAKPRRHTW